MSKNNDVISIKFPNGNSIVGPRVLDYARRYHKCLHDTTESILSLAETCYEASNALSSSDFELFKQEVGLTKSKGTLSKLLIIGANAIRLRRYKDRLPQAWTTLYILARLQPHEFKRILPILSSNLTAKDIDKTLNSVVHYNNKKSSVSIDISINLSNKGSKVKKMILSQLEIIAKKYGFLLVLGNSFKADIAATVHEDIA